MRRHVAALDGLRGVAVAAVVGYHLWPDRVPGGFLGVDLFFVLSGYLITSLLMEEYDRAGRIDLLGFAGRRLRRLLPAVLVAVTAVAVYVGARGDLGEIERVRRHGLATIGYVANWLFIADGDSYFADVAGPSMLRHVWSLAIEEQFYLVWPLAAWGALRLAGRRGLAVTAWAVATVSAVLMALWYDAVDPSRVYFGTDTRIFEPLIGAVAAAVVPLGSPSSRRFARVGSLATASWVLAVFLVDDRWTGFYQGGAVILAVAAAVVVMAAGTSDVGVLQGVLAWRPLVALGTISYGVYLWHWPLLIAVRREGWTGATADVAVIAATIAISALSYRLVERPIRRSERLVRWRPIGAAIVAMAVVASTVVVATRTTVPAEAVEVADAIDQARGARPEPENDAGVGTDAEPAPLEVVLIGDSSAWTLGAGWCRGARTTDPTTRRSTRSGSSCSTWLGRDTAWSRGRPPISAACGPARPTISRTRPGGARRSPPSNPIWSSPCSGSVTSSPARSTDGPSPSIRPSSRPCSTTPPPTSSAISPATRPSSSSRRHP